MPVTPDQPGPYAPASAVLEIVTRHRTKGLPTPVNAETLGRLGISDSLIARTIQTLKILDLIDEDEKPTQVLEGIRLAPEAEYQQRLKEWLNGAYADVLQFIDPETATETDIRDAFRSYKPVGQQSRMVTLFSGLYRAAGVGPEKPVPTQRSRSTTKASKPKAQKHSTSKPAQQGQRVDPTLMHATSGLPPAIGGLLASLPPEGGNWTQAQRDRFLTTFEAVLDFVYEIKAKSVDFGDLFGDEDESDED